MRTMDTAEQLYLSFFLYRHIVKFLYNRRSTPGKKILQVYSVYMIDRALVTIGQ